MVAEDEREFSYQISSGVGPNNWGLIHEKWAQCNEGNIQSPIDLLDQKVKTVWRLGKLQRSYRPSSATMVNRGHDIMARMETLQSYIVFVVVWITLWW